MLTICRTAKITDITIRKKLGIKEATMARLLNAIFAKVLSVIHYITNRQGIWILMYHHISDNYSAGELNTPCARFREQMQYLKKYCDVVTLNDVSEIYSGKKEMKRCRRPQVAVTIDDGYLDNYQNAFPILIETGINATFFLATGLVCSDQDRMARKNTYADQYLSWNEAKAMKHNNMALCPHTETHAHLSQLPRNEQFKEIKNSIQSLKQNVEAKNETLIFSYPYGQYNSTTKDVLKELGVQIAVTVTPGKNTLVDNPLELHRTCVNGKNSLINFMRALAPHPRAAYRKLFRISMLHLRAQQKTKKD